MLALGWLDRLKQRQNVGVSGFLEHIGKLIWPQILTLALSKVKQGGKV